MKNTGLSLIFSFFKLATTSYLRNLLRLCSNTRTSASTDLLHLFLILPNPVAPSALLLVNALKPPGRHHDSVFEQMTFFKSFWSNLHFI